MIRIIRFLLTGDWHLHQWETIDENFCTDEFGGAWTRYYCRCRVCGKHKKFD